MSFRNPLTGPVTIGGTVAVQTPSTPGLVLNQAQSLNNVASSGAVAFNTVVGGATITTVTLTPTAGKTLYVVSFDFSLKTTTTINTPTVTLSGGLARVYQFPNVASATGVGSITLPQPIPASAVSTAITFTFSYPSAAAAIAGNVGVLNCNGFEL